MNARAETHLPHATPALAEADRLMTVCNSCRYCEGLCAVFPAMEMRRAFGDGDLNYGHEAITEAYYSARLTRTFWLSLDYQLVLNPGYNKDRHGPVHVFGFRGHLGF